MLTSAHCLWQEYLGNPVANGIRAAFGYQWRAVGRQFVATNQNTYPVVAAANGYVSQNGDGVLVRGATDTTDFAVLVLGASASGAFPGDWYGWVQLRSWGPYEDALLGMIHHPKGLSKRFSPVKVEDPIVGCYPLDPDEDTCFEGSFYGSGGSSGAPVLDEDGCLRGIFKGRWYKVISESFTKSGRAVRVNALFRYPQINALVEEAAPLVLGRPLQLHLSDVARQRVEDVPVTVLEGGEQFLYVSMKGHHLLHLRDIGKGKLRHVDYSLYGGLKPTEHQICGWWNPFEARQYVAWFREADIGLSVYSTRGVGDSWRLEAETSLEPLLNWRPTPVSLNLLAAWSADLNTIHIPIWWPGIEIALVHLRRDRANRPFAFGGIQHIEGEPRNADAAFADAPEPPHLMRSQEGTWTAVWAGQEAQRSYFISWVRDPRHRTRYEDAEGRVHVSERPTLRAVTRDAAGAIRFAGTVPHPPLRRGDEDRLLVESVVIPLTYRGSRDQFAREQVVVIAATPGTIAMSIMGADNAWNLVHEYLCEPGQTIDLDAGVSMIANHADWTGGTRASVDLACAIEDNDGQRFIVVFRYPDGPRNGTWVQLAKVESPRRFARGVASGRIVYSTRDHRLRTLVERDGRWLVGLMSGMAGMPIGWTYTPHLEQSARPLRRLRER